MASDKPKYNMVERDGEEMRLYENGTLQRQNDKGQWVFAPGTKKMVYDSETGKAAALVRWDRHKEAKMLGLQAATLRDTPDEAVEEWLRVGAEHGIKGGPAGSAYYKQVSDLVGLHAPKETKASLHADRDGITASGDPEFVTRLIEGLAAERERRDTGDS